MAELPTGTVTFLFTDVEGSTRLLQEHGGRYAEMLEEHRRLLRESFERHRGVEVDTQGDAFFVAFAKASDALAAAADARDALAVGPIHVRMGLHTGEPLVSEGGYVGIDVHRAARIAAAGHGGQILVSQATRDLAGGNELRDLGQYRLKDLTAPERIYQLGESDFPPLKSLNESALPVASNPLVGRERELQDLLALFRNSARLVTLTGTGGSGKTRLGLQVAAELVDDFRGGVFFVPLAGVAQPELVEATVAAALGAQRLPDQGGREILVLIDSFEHVLPAAPVVGSLLSGGPSARVLVTSRAPLRLDAEREYPVDPLSGAEALEFLTQRARAVRPDFEPDDAAQEICVRLDGLPLALELAASRLRSLGNEALLHRLGQRLPVLTAGRRDVPERQRTLRATIEWSYDLLLPHLQDVFARLSVFAGTFSVDAAEAIVDATFDDLDALVEASLLKPVRDDRLLMLDTIKEYAAEQVAAEPGLWQERHAMYFLGVAEDADAKLKGAEQTTLMARLRADDDNFRSALTFFEQSESWESLLRLTAALGRYWYVRANLPEARAWLERARAHAKTSDPELQARSASALAAVALTEGRCDEATRALLEEALAGFRAASNLSRSAETISDFGFLAVLAGDFSLAGKYFEEARELAERIGDRWVYATATVNLVEQALVERDFERAVGLSLEAQRLFGEIGDEWAEARCAFNVALASVFAGRPDEARQPLRELLENTHVVGHLETAVWSLALWASVACGAGEFRPAAVLLGAVEHLCETTGIVFQPNENAARVTATDVVKSKLDAAALAEAWSRGRAMELDEAVDYALSLD